MTFLKHFRKRIYPYPNLLKKFEERLGLFMENPHHFLLKDHSLKGKKLTLRAFSLTGDMRIIYQVVNGVIYFLDVGSHNQVY